MTKIESLLKKHQEWKSKKPVIEEMELRDYGKVFVRPALKEIVIMQNESDSGRINEYICLSIDKAYDLYSFLDDLFQEEKIKHREEIS
jgi:hypothetical protein